VRITIGERQVGNGCPIYIIAEAGVNHAGNADVAVKMIEAAARAGASAVKFQTFVPERVASPSAPRAAYQSRSCGGGGQLEMLRSLALGERDHRRLYAAARELGVEFLSTPFDESSAALLYSLGVPAFKVSSGDLTNVPFLRHLGRMGRPLILSTGMATLGEIEEALDAVSGGGANPADVVLLQCASSYPASPDEVNLRAIEVLKGAFGTPVGLSDHTEGIHVACAAVALGASVVEKHFTIDRSLGGPDQSFSLLPDELARLVQGVREVERAMGSGHKRPSRDEGEMRVVSRRSLHAAREIPAGTRICESMIAVTRPADGLHPRHADDVVGRKARVGLSPGDPITWEVV